MSNKKKLIVFYVIIASALWMIFGEDERINVSKDKIIINKVKEEPTRKSHVPTKHDAYVLCKMLVGKKFKPSFSTFPYMERESSSLKNKNFIIKSSVMVDGTRSDWTCNIKYKQGEILNINNWDYNLTF
jgi:hypothetical protein